MDDTAQIVERLRSRFPMIKGPRKDDICYATQNRQDAVKKIIQDCDLVLVVGSPNSSNSNRLREIASKRGIQAFLIDGPDEIKAAWLSRANKIGVTAGASAPEELVQQVIDRLKESGTKIREFNGPEENIAFSLPALLR